MANIITVTVHGVAGVKHATNKAGKPCSWVTIFDPVVSETHKIYLEGHVSPDQFPQSPTTYQLDINVPETLFLTRGASVRVVPASPGKK